MRNVISGMIDFLCSYTTFQDTFYVIFSLANMNSSRAVNKINSFSKSDVLPNFGFSWNRGGFTYFSFLQRIYNTWFTNVWISDKTNTDIFLVSMENIKLTENVDKRAFSERICYARSVGNSRIAFAEIFNPFSNVPDRD